MSEELDHNGTDIRVNYRNHIINYQVKKESMSREVRKPKKSKNALQGEYIGLNYQVPNDEYFANPKKKNGKFKTPYLRFINTLTLKRLDNGFVVFKPETFEPKKREIDST